MSGEISPDNVRRERLTEAVTEFERRIRDQVLALDRAECWDVLLNRPPAFNGNSPQPPASPLPLRYETHEGVSLLRVILPAAENRACLECELFGRAHCCGGLEFLYYALRDTGVENPLKWLAIEIEPGLHLPDWELMTQNLHQIVRKLREYFESHLESVRAYIGEFM
jgi:hypothetical protein